MGVGMALIRVSGGVWSITLDGMWDEWEWVGHYCRWVGVGGKILWVSGGEWRQFGVGGGEWWWMHCLIMLFLNKK